MVGCSGIPDPFEYLWLLCCRHARRYGANVSVESILLMLPDDSYFPDNAILVCAVGDDVPDFIPYLDVSGRDALEIPCVSMYLRSNGFPSVIPEFDFDVALPSRYLCK